MPIVICISNAMSHMIAIVIISYNTGWTANLEKFRNLAEPEKVRISLKLENLNVLL